MHTYMRMKGRWGLAAIFLGFLLVALGAGGDWLMHWMDPMLAAREGPFALSNPSHLLMGLGAVVSFAGACRLLGNNAGQARSAPKRLTPPTPAESHGQDSFVHHHTVQNAGGVLYVSLPQPHSPRS